MDNRDKQNKDKLMWQKYGFNVGYKKSVENVGQIIYFTKGLTFSRGINDFELKGNLDIETAKYIFISILDRIDEGQEIKDGIIFADILGLYTIKFINNDNGNIKLMIV